MIAYLCDDSLRRELNAQKQNYWDVYLREVCNQLGVTAHALSFADMENPNSLNGLRSLLIGCQSGGKLSTKTRNHIREWVEKGGLVIGFDITGFDDIFGVKSESVLRQPGDEYTITAHFEFHPHSLTREVHPFMLLEQRLLAISDVTLVKLNGAQELARLYDPSGKDLDHPAITWHSCGKGLAAFFAFDVAKTIWLLHQGRPLPDIPEGEWAARTPELQVIGPNSQKVAYADEIVHLLQNMIATTRQPFIYPIPPDDGKIPDALFYYSGDEYTGPTEDSLHASDFMARQGLPYHINIAAHLHPMTKAEFDHIRANGHEVSSYMWIWTDDRKGSVITRERFQMQSEALQKRFGVKPGSVLVGSCQWRGWVETARWLAEAGATADNTFIGAKIGNAGARRNPKTSAERYGSPWYNGPFYGYGFGTSYPFFFYEAWDRGNERISLQEQPIICYELGHRGSNAADPAEKTRETETFAPEDLHEPIDRAVRYHLVMNLFYHPWYIAHCPYARAAIEEIKRYIAYKGAHVLHMANNAVVAWWNARANATITDIETSVNKIRFVCRCEWVSGVIVRIQVSGATVVRAHCDGAATAYQTKREFGEDWLYLISPRGEHRLEIGLSS